jgi:excisionase family DNA binding protein
MPELLNREAAAQYIGVSVRTLNRLVDRKEIPRSEVPGPKGQEARFDQSDLDAYLERNKPHALMRSGAVLPATLDATTGAAQLAVLFASAMRDALPPVPVELLPVSEAARRVGLPARVLKAAVDAGELPAHHIPGQKIERGPKKKKYKVRGRVRSDDLQRWLNNRFPPAT